MIDVKEFVKQKFNIERELYLHNKVDDMDYVDLIQLLNDFQQQLLNKHNVSGALPLLTECKDAASVYADKKGGGNYGEIFRAYQEGINWALNKVTSGNDR